MFRIQRGFEDKKLESNLERTPFKILPAAPLALRLHGVIRQLECRKSLLPFRSGQPLYCTTDAVARPAPEFVVPFCVGPKRCIWKIGNFPELLRDPGVVGVGNQ